MALTINISIKQHDDIYELLSQKWWSEWKVIDGEYQHKDRLSFYDWLFKKGYINENELKKLKR